MVSLDKEIVYLAGPMRGYVNFNKEAFYDAEEVLRNAGYEVINPARNPSGLTVAQYMQIDLNSIFHCTCIYLLRGWRSSAGAQVEYALAKYLGLKIMYQEMIYD